MARSLTVRHEEKLTLNWLFGGFLLLAIGWMLLSALATGGAEANAAGLDRTPTLDVR